MNITKENREKILTLLREGTCPICGKCGFKMPLVHIALVHDIKEQEFKDKLLIGRQEGFATPGIRKKLKETGSNSKNGMTAGNFRRHDDVSKEKMRILKKQHFIDNPQNLQAFKDGNKKNHPNAIKKAAEVNKKPIVRVSESGEVKQYESMSDAARDNNVSVGGLSDCLSGKYRTLGGYFWGTPDNIPAPGKIINTKSGVKGVTWIEGRRKWMAHIWRNGKSVNLGWFDNTEDAIRARKEAEKEEHHER